MAATDKRLSPKDQEQAIRNAYNDVNSTVGVDGFLTGLVGRRVDQAISTTNVANDTATLSFSENGTGLYTIRVVYTDGTRSELLHAERIA